MKLDNKRPQLSINNSNLGLRDFYENYVNAANNRDYQKIKDLISETVLLNGQDVKRESVIAEFKMLIDAVPDFKWFIEDIIIEDDRIAARLTDKGTPKEITFFGKNSKSKSVVFTEFGYYKVNNGLFVEMNYLIDIPAVIRQLAD